MMGVRHPYPPVFNCPSSAFFVGPGDDADKLARELSAAAETVKLRGRPDELSDFATVQRTVSALHLLDSNQRCPTCVFAAPVPVAKLLIDAGLVRLVTLNGEPRYQVTGRPVELFRPWVYEATAAAMRLAALVHRRWRIASRQPDDEVRAVWQSARRVLDTLPATGAVEIADGDVAALLIDWRVVGRNPADGVLRVSRDGYRSHFPRGDF